MTDPAVPRGPSLEDLLGRVRASGDLAALALLFDATAPELFRIALTMSPDAASAEDAVQETFLTLLQSVDRFDPARRVLPWLLGILRLKVQEVRRRNRRAPRGERLRIVEPAADDPSRELERKEEEELVRRSLEALPEPYRSVALLRWRYGLEPAEIAHLRREPPGTIRSLLSRALQRLKRELVRIPAVFGIRWPRGLPAVREEVLARAVRFSAAAAGEAAAAATRPWWAQAAAALGLLLLLAGGAWRWLIPRGGTAPERTPAGRASPLLAAGPPAPVPAPAAPEPGPAPPLPAAGPEPPPSRAADAPPVQPSRWTIAGRVVDRDREPVPGAEVQVFFMRGPDVADEAARVIADDGGKYEAELPLLDRLSPVERATILVGAQATAPGCCPFGGVLDQPLGRREPGRLRLDVQAERGVRIRGRIVGPDQRPVRDACVRLIAEDPTLPPGRDQLTDDQGRYWVCAGRPGRYRVVASAFGLGFVSSDPVEAGAAKDVSLPDLALRGIGVIEGVATTSDGRPLPDLLVVAMPTWVWESRNARAHPWLLWGVRADEALHPGEGLTDGQVRSDAEGRFRIAGLRPGRYVLVALELDDLANPPVRLCQTGGRRDVVAGTHRLRIVVRDDSGRPIPGARLSFNGDRPSRDVRERSGTLTLPVRPGETIECIASVLGYQHAEAVFRVPEQPEDHRVELVLQGARPRGRLEVLLKDPDGAVIPEFLGHVYSRTGFSLVTVEGRPDREPRFTALPCGRFRLYLTPGREGRDFWLQLERDLELEPDVPTTVALVADRVGGRVHLRLVPPPDSIPGDTFDVQVDARRPGSVRPESGDRFESKAQIPRFRWLVNTAPKGQVESGEPGEVSLLLEPGAYDLRIRTDNHRTFERPITVVARQAQRIEVQLEQR